MIEAGLFYLLSHTAAITSICGTNPTRVYPGNFPTGPSYPAMAYKIIGTRPGPTLDTSGMQRLRMEFECRAADALTASTMREALRELLEGYRGLLNDGTLLQDGQLIQMMDGYVDDPRVYVRMIEFYLFFNFSS